MPSLFGRSSSKGTLTHPQPTPSLAAALQTDETRQFVDTLVPPASPNPTTTSNSSASPYGHLSPYPTLILGLADLRHLVSLVTTHLDIETPFVFNSDALDLNAGRVKRVIDQYVLSLTPLNRRRDAAGGFASSFNFDEEARFAGSHELAMLLRWGMARVVRIETSSSPSSIPNTTTPLLSPPPPPPPQKETLTHGLIPYLAYLNWAKQEHIQGYPPTHFSSLLATQSSYTTYETYTTETGQLAQKQVVKYREVVPGVLKDTLVELFGMLARLVAHSAKSGITPPSLSPFFGPLLFGLGPVEGLALGLNAGSFGSPEGAGGDVDSTSFETTYRGYLRSVHAFEHVLLSFIRWQDTPVSQGGGGEGAGGLPGRLKEWIRDYPRVLGGVHSDVILGLGSGSAGGRGSGGRIPMRKGAKTSRVVSVRRTVARYEKDLVRAGARWALPHLSASSSGASFITSPTGVHGSSLGGSREWGRIAPSSKEGDDKLAPRYSDMYRKKMDIPNGVEPGSSPFAPVSLGASFSSSSSSSYTTTTTSSSGITRSTSAMSNYATTNDMSFSSSATSPSSSASSPGSPSTPSTSSHSHNSLTQSQRFKTLTDAQWGLFESSGFLAPSLSSSSSSSSSLPENALRFDLTESARKARLGIISRASLGGGGGSSFRAMTTSSGRGAGMGGSAGNDDGEESYSVEGGIPGPYSFSGYGYYGGTTSSYSGGYGGKKRESVSWGDFVNGGFDREKEMVPQIYSGGGGAGAGGAGRRGVKYGGGGVGKENSDGDGVAANPPKKKTRRLEFLKHDRGYVGADGKLADVAEFALDTGLDAALQFSLGEFGVLELEGMLMKEREKREKEKEKEENGHGHGHGDREREREKAMRRKRKEKPLPPFTWSTTPILASETLIESAFLDVWVDLLSWGFAGNVDLDVVLGEGGGAGSGFGVVDWLWEEHIVVLLHPCLGWSGRLTNQLRWPAWCPELDPNTNVSGLALSRTFSRDDGEFQDPADTARWRSEFFKECNWALVEFKALPNSSSPALSSTSSSNDPRTSTSLLLGDQSIYYPQPSLRLSTSSSSSNYASSSSSIGRVRLGSLFSSPIHGNGASTTSLVDTVRGKKEKKVKEAKSKKDKKDKTPNFFTGSTRTLTLSTPTPYDPRNGGHSGTPTPTPYSRQNMGDGSLPTTPIGSTLPVGEHSPRGDSLNMSSSSKAMDFEGMLRDETRGTKVIRLNGALHTVDSHGGGGGGGGGGGMSDAEAGYTDDDGKYSEHSRTTHEGLLPEGAMAPRAPGSSGSHRPPAVATTSGGSPSADAPHTPSAKRTANIFRLPTTPMTSPASSSPKQHQPSAKPKGPKARRHSKQNLVPAEYHTVEFETRLTSGGETEEEGADGDLPSSRNGDGANAAAAGDEPGSGDGFLEEAARRRKAARLAERERLRSERRGGGAKRFSLGLGGSKGVDDVDDDTWVDIVVPSMGGARTTGGSGGESRAKDPDEASQEVARVLNAVRGGQPYALDDESDLEDPPVPAKSQGGVVRSSDYSDDIEVQTVPRKGDIHPHNGEHHHLYEEIGNGHHGDKTYLHNDDSKEEEASVIPKRRLGYFDLHPDRRPPSLTSQEPLEHPRDTTVGTIGTIESEDPYGGDDDEDPRSRYAHSSDDENHEPEEGSADRPRDLDKLYAIGTHAQKEHEKDKIARPLPTLPPTSPSPSSPAPAPVTPSKPNILTATTSGTPGKTAALIEMYREKEKKSTTSPVLHSPQPKVPSTSPTPSPAPSRIPVKTGLPAVPSPASSAPTPSSKSPPLSLPTSPAAPVPAAKPPSKRNTENSTIGINSELDDDEDDTSAEVNMEELIPPKLGGDDGGRGSPARYIHGAPLHNVLEEEEEED
ncbi:hypothetical protein D9757_006610 [Collybiopsis confluens]|uniref:Meiotically up-regulated protein Msb1/Mug8 domain-containing protein n=1 Tax=Collybiopsis confluens TaxID=2823264 RepID=A0A8H5HQ97_9AGAR|nr:hypothetical protein D9757_006610 [Collybiopsis confluens]